MSPSCVVPRPIGIVATLLETLVTLGAMVSRRPVDERINLQGPRRRRILVLLGKLGEHEFFLHSKRGSADRDKPTYFGKQALHCIIVEK